MHSPTEARHGTASETKPTGASLHCHLAILRRGDSEIVVTQESGGFRLPAVAIPCGQRVAPNLLPTVRDLLGLVTVCRFDMAAEGLGADERCVILEAIASERPLVPGQAWLPVRGLDWNCFEPSDRDLLWQVLARLSSYATGRLSGRFVLSGWLDEVTEWIRACLAPKGLRLGGLSAQYNMGPNFSLLRFETSGCPIWFKAVGHPNSREFDITLRLAELEIPHTPRPIAARSEWRAWLTFEAHGKHPDEISGWEGWKTVAHCLAELQIQSLGHASTLIAAGCSDFRIEGLRGAIEPCLSKFAALMELQPGNSPARLELGDLRLIEERLKDACRESEILEAPSTLGHSDFNAGNILVGQNQACFLDWVQGHVGPPFLTLEYLTLLLRHFASTEDDQVHAVRAEYLRPWRRLCSAAQLARLAALAPLLAVFSYALVCLSSGGDARDMSPERAGYIRSLARRTHHEVQKLESPARLPPSAPN